MQIKESHASPVPKRLKDARQAKGLSQKELGIAAGIDEFSASPRMNQYERGKHTPDFSMLKKLAKVLGVPTAYFYADDDWLASAICALNKLPEDEKKNFSATD
ncbi:XRE family transcriptional regulator [Mariprofundus sp. EBB-1]|uniref:helix-turn-helix domain-containing protein n=1 Tax=Mariprofundus sp. EBB-1 TaxID=2650971 RepID=UPI000EF196B0|nr:helix-turn-helix transcriptional regulator [Mariprofundus sp. EBB-1]RLL49810.1 XRE family transcriptional regulator [Mariprofundus sp. EBB-1]